MVEFNVHHLSGGIKSEVVLPVIHSCPGWGVRCQDANICATLEVRVVNSVEVGFHPLAFFDWLIEAPGESLCAELFIRRPVERRGLCSRPAANARCARHTFQSVLMLLRLFLPPCEALYALPVFLELSIPRISRIDQEGAHEGELIQHRNGLFDVIRV